MKRLVAILSPPPCIRRAFARLLIVLLVTTMLPLPAWAQDALPDSPGGIAMTTGYIVGMGILAGAGALLIWWLKSKASTSAGFAVLHQLSLVAQAVVAHVEAKVRPEIKLALSDGRLTAEERLRIQTIALTAFKEAAGPRLLEQAKKFFGAGGLDTILSGLLEWALKRFKGEAAPLVVPAVTVSSIANPR